MSTELRIGDSERDAAVAALGEHFAAGRIDKDEFDQRTAAAWIARSSGDLAPLFADLPTPHTPPTADSRTAGPRGSSADWPDRARRPRLWSSGLVRTAVLVLIVALAVTETIPWFVAAIMAWIWFVGRAHTRWHRSTRHWHHHHRPPRHAPARRGSRA